MLSLFKYEDCLGMGDVQNLWVSAAAGHTLQQKPSALALK